MKFFAKPYVGPTALVLAVILVYAGSFRGQFTNWDDKTLVVENPAICSLAPTNLVEIFTPTPGATYQPVRVLSYALDYAIWELSPVGYHLTNTCLHVVATLLLFVFVRRLLTLATKHPKNDITVIAFFVALIFAVHPVNVESVAWISSRKYGLLGTFAFASLYTFVRLLEPPPYAKRLVISCALATALALLSSPFGIVLFPLMLLIDFLRTPQPKVLAMLRSSRPAYIAAATPFLVIVPLIGVGLLGGDQGPVASHHQSNIFITIMTMLRVLCDYAINLTLPLWLNCKYPNTLVLSLASPKVWIVIVALIALARFVCRRYKTGDRLPAFCFAWFFIALAPVSNLIPISTTMADRYLYLASMGPILGLVLFCRANLPPYALIVIAVIFAGLAHRQSRVWSDSTTLWRASLAVDEANPVAHSNLASALEEVGDVEEAIAHYRRALEIYDAHAPAQKNLGSLLVAREDYVQAEIHLQRAVELEPQFAAAWNNLGACQMASGRVEEAQTSFKTASNLEPSSRQYAINHGLAASKLGQPAAAKDSFDRACELAPDRCVELGMTIAVEGSCALAIVYLQRVITQSAPGNDKAFRRLARCLFEEKRVAESADVLRRALQLYPGDESLQKLLATLEAQLP